MILHAIPNLVKAAGTSVYCAELCDELFRQGVSSRIAVAEDPGPNWCTTLPSVRVERFDASMKVPDVIHVHGIWSPFLHRVAAWGMSRDVPIVISPQGMLTRWALGQKWLKKRVAMQVYQMRDLKAAMLLHATAESEVEDIRRLGLRQPIVVAPFGIDMPAQRSVPVRGAENVDGPSATARGRTALFVSRVHPKKGLANLVAAWSRLKREAGGGAVAGRGGCRWRLVVAGPDECGHTGELIEQATASGLTARVIAATDAEGVPSEADMVFVGPVYDGQKTALYQSADLFVLPTHSENFGVVILEALACGLPTITTKGAPWQALDDVGRPGDEADRPARAGWWIDIGVEPLVEALRQAVNATDDELKRIGDNGRWFARERYSWPAAGRRMKSAYEWLIHGGAAPDCIRL